MCLSPDSGEEKDEDADRLSEAWRSNPVFVKDEVNITRLGKSAAIAGGNDLRLYPIVHQMRPRLLLSCCPIGLSWTQMMIGYDMTPRP